MNIGGGGTVGALLSVVFPVAGAGEGRGDLGSSVVGWAGSDIVVVGSGDEKTGHRYETYIARRRRV
jgi:hypothetical protein